MNNLLLLVEGRDDVNVISRLLEKHNLTRLRNPNDTGIHPRKLFWGDIPLDIMPVSEDGSVIEKFEATLEYGRTCPKVVGLVLDFDGQTKTQANNRDMALRNVVVRLQNTERRWDLPNNFTVLSEPGFIAEPADEDTPRIGIWFMPNNRDRGMLESFLQGLIPESQSGLLDFARHSTDMAKAEHHAPFKPVHQDKAVVHTFLAWMDEPGHPFGLSFQNGSFDAKSATANLFVEWMKKLFR